jgi:hypothetical protein
VLAGPLKRAAAHSCNRPPAGGLVPFSSIAKTVPTPNHRWLQEKRCEAYVAFLSATRNTYDAIEKRGRPAKAPREFQDLAAQVSGGFTAVPVAAEAPASRRRQL